MRGQPIIDRLDGLGFTTIGGALEFAGLNARPGRLPAAYVITEGSTASEAARTAVVDQRVAVEFSVILVLAANARQDVVSDDLDTFCKAVIGRLLGWTHPDMQSPTQFAADRLMSVDGTVLVWGLRFRTSYHLRKVA